MTARSLARLAVLAGAVAVAVALARTPTAGDRTNLGWPR